MHLVDADGEEDPEFDDMERSNRSSLHHSILHSTSEYNAYHIVRTDSRNSRYSMSPRACY